MTFLNALVWPIIAIGLIPLAIHLINKKKPAEKPFAAFDFLLRVDKITRKRIRFQSLLLFLIRTLLLLLAAFVAMQPVLHGGSWKETKRSGRIIAIVDPSLSMRLISSGVSGFDAGLSFVGKYAEREGVKEILLLSPGKEMQRISLNGYSGEFEDKTEKLEPDYSRGSLEATIREAVKLSLSEGRIDRIFVVSDFCAHSWNALPDSLFADFSIPVVFCNTKDTLSYSRGVTAVTAEQHNDGMGVRMTIINSSDKPMQDWPLSLTLGEKTVMNTFVTQEAHSTVSRLLLLTGYEKAEPGNIRQSPDSLSEDDIRYFVFQPQGMAKILIVDGDQAAHFTDAESYYFEKAVSTDPLVSVRVIPSMSLNKKVLEDYDLLCLLNYVPDETFKNEIDNFVKSGNGLFISMGNKVVIDQFNTVLATTAGAILREKKAGYGRDFAETEPLALPIVQHSAVNSMAELLESDNYLFNNIFLIEPMADRNTETLLRLRSGDPLLLYRSYGNGRVALYLSSIDMAWNNFPLRPFFVPFARGLARNLSGKEQRKGGDSLFCGDSIVFDSKSEMVLIDDPSGVRHNIVVRNNKALFYNALLPGHYTLFDGKEIRPFCVNTPPGESDLTQVSDEKLNTITAGSMNTVVRIRYSREADVSLPRPIWHYLLFAIIILLLIETIIATERRKSET
jgi:hypothetical protein